MKSNEQSENLLKENNRPGFEEQHKIEKTKREGTYNYIISLYISVYVQSVFNEVLAGGAN